MEDALVWFGAVAFALLGLVFGSFGNVVIWRFPRGESVVSPGSHCPACGSPVRWYDNIPVVSWIALRGRCRDCGAAIAPRYLIVEAVSGALFALAVVKFGVSLQAAFAASLFWLLLVLSVIDLDCMRLPNPLVAGLAAVGFVGTLVSEFTELIGTPLVPLPAAGVLSSPIAWGILGAALGAGVPGSVALIYGLVRGKRGLGMGDIKLLGALGFFLGPYVVLTLFFGSIIGAVVGVLGLKQGPLSDTRIPFGPSLAAAAVIVALVGPAVVTWYFGLTGIA